jgi:hypothetical protein
MLLRSERTTTSEKERKVEFNVLPSTGFKFLSAARFFHFIHHVFPGRPASLGLDRVGAASRAAAGEAFGDICSFSPAPRLVSYTCVMHGGGEGTIVGCTSLAAPPATDSPPNCGSTCGATRTGRSLDPGTSERAAAKLAAQSPR